jgi:hypothetical protein
MEEGADLGQAAIAPKIWWTDPLFRKPLSNKKFWPPLLEMFSYAEKKLSPNDKNRYKLTNKKIYNCTAACEFFL